MEARFIDAFVQLGVHVRGAVVPTATILDAFVAEGDIPIRQAYENVASWFQMPVESVREAIDFEFSLRQMKNAA
jgi:hypothetical protein